MDNIEFNFTNFWGTMKLVSIQKKIIKCCKMLNFKQIYLIKTKIILVNKSSVEILYFSIQIEKRRGAHLLFQYLLSNGSDLTQWLLHQILS
ncbi:hypothetical protein BpHYR1_002206 [Brachionus plicatilis]|uniref:Uncharacterized protein n=1 Tax=Brachionus plicatilis TaxID=10195 RepID=A0A3M7R2C7_BRAPC|nr:hypothetical protein BpHYR1_002206 [Brachionus plicatilis]